LNHRGIPAKLADTRELLLPILILETQPLDAVSKKIIQIFNENKELYSGDYGFYWFMINETTTLVKRK
jgi:hypothetical protein